MSTWVKLIDTFADHPKVIAAGDDAAWLYVCGLLYCSRHLTDGEIPKRALDRLTGFTPPKRRRLAKRLEDVRLWIASDDGWLVHDYASVQRTKAQVEGKRETDRKRQARSRSSHGVTPEPVTVLSRRDSAASRAADSAASRFAEVEVEVEKNLAPQAQEQTHATTLHAIVVALGLREESITDSQWSDLGKTAKDLIGVGATPEQIAAFPRWWARTYDKAKLTHRCFRQHWSAYLSPATTSRCRWCAGMGSLNGYACNHRDDPMVAKEPV